MGPQPAGRGRPFLARRLADSRPLRERVEAAERLGISLRRFEGWEPTTYYTYDGDRLISSTPEAEWTEQDQGWILALAEYRSTRCPCGCGQDVRESTDPANAYYVGPGTRCQARTALSIAQKVQSESPQPEAFLFKVERR
jgi:hypothetical protein